MTTSPKRLFYVLPRDWTWWAWLATVLLLAIGLAGNPVGFYGAIALTILQSSIFLHREGSVRAFSVQLRLAYLALLVVCLHPALNWLYWVPILGTLALVLFGYCLLARVLSLLPWNRRETITAELLQRTFLSRPQLSLAQSIMKTGCAGGLCTIEAQVRERPAANAVQIAA